MVAAVFGALVAVGCGADEQAGPKTAVQPVALPKQGITVASLQDLADKVGCPALQRNPSGTSALEMGSCSDQVVLSTYEDRPAVLRAVNDFWSLRDSLDPDGTVLGPSKLLTGENWMINCGNDMPFCWRARDVVGGEIVMYERNR